MRLARVTFHSSLLRRSWPPSLATHTMSISAHGQGDAVWYFHLHHCRLVIHYLLDSNHNLVDIFPVDLFAILESLHHVINELLRHGIAEANTVVIRLDLYRVEIETFRCRRFISDLDGGEEIELAHNLLAFRQLELRILIVGLEPGAGFEVLERFLGF